jgi:hypothetical protein
MMRSVDLVEVQMALNVVKCIDVGQADDSGPVVQCFETQASNSMRKHNMDAYLGVFWPMNLYMCLPRTSSHIKDVKHHHEHICAAWPTKPMRATPTLSDQSS